jgi:MFS family permease
VTSDALQADGAGNWRELLLAVYVPSFFTACAQNAILIALPLYALDLEAGPAVAAAMLGLRGIGTLVSDVPAGMAVSRFGDKSVMLAGLTMLGVMAFGSSAIGSAWLLGGLAIVFGAGIGTWLLGRISYIADHVGLERRGRVIAVMAGLQRAGALAGPFAAGVTADAWGWPVVFLGAGVLVLVAVVFIVVFASSVRPTFHEDPISHGVGMLVHILKEHAKIFRVAGSAVVTLQLMRAGRQVLIPLWGAAIGLDASDIGLIFSLSFGVDMMMFYPAGLILDHLGRKYAAVPCMLLLATSLALMPGAADFQGLLLVALLAGLGNGFGTGIVMTLGSDLSPLEGRGEFLGVWRLVGDIGTASGPFIIGALAEGLTLASACVITAAVGLAGSLVMILRVRETRRPHAPT